jgi:hypothetical protein
MRIIITEEQFNRFNRSSPALHNGIIRYLTLMFENGRRSYGKKNNNYGNLSEQWCIDGAVGLYVSYYFKNGEFNIGKLLVSQSIIDVFEEWYEDVMIPKFEELVNESGLSVDVIEVFKDERRCPPEFVKPEGITDDEMIDYIVANTLFKRKDVIKQIEDGVDLDVLYFGIKNRDNK